jgi:two-component system chemotaxis response regulator CheB
MAPRRPFSCPDCGGVLFEADDAGLPRYRCRVGHGFTGEALEEGQEQMVDSALWADVRELDHGAGRPALMAPAPDVDDGHSEPSN